MRTIDASEFEIHCLAFLDEVAEARQEFLILKCGKPVARLLPVPEQATSPQATLLGTMVSMDDLLEPPLPLPTSDGWQWPLRGG